MAVTFVETVFQEEETTKEFLKQIEEHRKRTNMGIKIFLTSHSDEPTAVFGPSFAKIKGII